METRTKIAIGVACAVVLGLVAWWAYGEGAAAGAGGAALVAAEAWRRRGERRKDLEDAITDASETIERIEQIEEEVEAVPGDNMDEASAMTGDEQADFLNELTGED